MNYPHYCTNGLHYYMFLDKDKGVGIIDGILMKSIEYSNSYSLVQKDILEDEDYREITRAEFRKKFVKTFKKLEGKTHV